MMVRVFANGPGDLGLIPGWVITKTQKWYLMPPCLTLCIIRYGSRVKWSNPGKGKKPSSTPWYSSYRKGSLQVTNFTFFLLYWDLVLSPQLIKILRNWLKVMNTTKDYTKRLHLDLTFQQYDEGKQSLVVLKDTAGVF